MIFYIVVKNNYYLDRSGCDSFEPVPMVWAEARRAARIGRGVVAEGCGEFVRSLPAIEMRLPELELAA